MEKLQELLRQYTRIYTSLKKHVRRKTVENKLQVNFADKTFNKTSSTVVAIIYNYIIIIIIKKMHKNIFNGIIKTYHHPWLSYHIVILISHTRQSFYYNHVFMSYMAVIILLLPLVVQCLLFSIVTKSFCGLFLMVFVS